MFSIPFVQPKERVAVVVYIGSASAGVAFGVLRNDHFTLVASHTTEAILNDRTREHTIAAVLQSLSESVAKAREEYASTPTFQERGTPSIGYAVLESPWARTCAVQGERMFETETRITKELMMDVAREALSSECIPPMPEAMRDNRFEATTVRVELNGYPTEEPIGKRATEIAVRAIASNAEPKILNAAKDALLSLGITTPLMRSSARALYSAAHRMNDVGEEYLLVHLTDGSLYFLDVRRGVPHSSATVPIGLHEILKRVSGDRLPEETLSLFSLIERGACSEKACTSFQEDLVRFEPELVRVIGEAMTEISDGKKIPQHLVLLADSRVDAWLSNIFSRIDFEQFTMTTQPYSVRSLELPRTLSIQHESMRVNPSLKIASALVAAEN